MKNQILNEDCLLGMPRIPAASIDMIFADLPYGMLKTKHTLWDIKIPFKPLWEQYSRVLKENGVVILTGVHPFTNEIINSIPKGYKYQELIWYKSSGSGFLNAKIQHIRQHENVLVIYKKRPTYNPQKYQIDKRFVAKGKAKKKNNAKNCKAFDIRGKASQNYVYKDDGSRYPDSVLEFLESVLPIKSAHRKGMHPTEKPMDLVAYLIRTFTNKGQTILDNCMGSGTTAVAAILEGRNFIGFEMDVDYYNMAMERIVQAREQVNQQNSSTIQKVAKGQPKDQ